MKLTAPRHRKVSINLTALIDILFLLIIFFAVSTQFAHQRSIAVDLPESETSSPATGGKALVITMSKIDKLFINGVPVHIDALNDAIALEAYDRSRRVILNVDRTIPHGHVIRLLDVLKLHQFKKVAFGTDGRP
jgi:biopolymer transport protein ExbD